MKHFLLGLLLFSYLPLSHALDSSEVKLLTFSNDRTAITDELSLTLDAQGSVQGVAYLVNDGKTAEKDFSLATLAGGDGAVLEEQQGVKAIELLGHVNSAAGTGQFVIHYVANGLSGSYSDCNVNLQRGSSGWVLINAYTGQPVKTAKIITYSLGITTIEGICPASI